MNILFLVRLNGQRYPEPKALFAVQLVTAVPPVLVVVENKLAFSVDLKTRIVLGLTLDKLR